RPDVIEALEFTAICCTIIYLVMHLLARRRERLLAEARAAAGRFRTLTELSADWFWETDAEQRVVWLSGGTPVATFFGHTPTYARRFWEIPGVEVDPGALQAHRQRLAQQLPFFDLEISRTDERGARQIHIISGRSRLDAEGGFLGYRGVGRDVTEQRSAERKLFQAKARLELALDGGNLAEWHYDTASGGIYAGDGWVRFLGHTASPEISDQRGLLALLHPDDAQRHRDAVVLALKTGSLDSPFRLRSANGEWKWLHARGRVTERDAAGRARGMSGTLTDIDARKRAEDALRSTELRFGDVAGLSREYVWETDAEWRYTYLSERAEAVLGYERAEMLGRRPRDFMPLGECEAFEAKIAAGLEARAEFRDIVHRSLGKAGGLVWQSVSGVPMRDAQGQLAGYRGTAADVTARKQAEMRIEFLATRDALTGLPNRALLAERARQAILAAARGRSQLALLCVDLDRFKLVNDSLDHRTGDALLRAVSERLGGLLQDETVARVGGDEFVVLAPIQAPEDAAALAQRLLDVLARPFSVEGRSLGVAASIGIGVYPADGRDFAELLKNADAAMFHAKESGRGTFRFFSPELNTRAVERLRLENDLRGALARGELALRWHPVVRHRSEIVGAEALVRWHHPERGLLPPEDFVPLAEECGLIRAVGEWTLERALSQAGAWLRKSPGRAWFAVNVSAAELSQGEAFYRRLSRALQANGLQGSSLELEVTERVLLSNLP
ncbi:MAG TPA: diguanylate cyclase, partial [Burkholderiales bacterium]|nr:diguanylate cyclase [Burkholderiales bacterium]